MSNNNGKNTVTAISTITPQEWPIVTQQATMLCKTGFLPESVNTPEKAIAIMMKGRELGIGPMYALSNISVIKGKPVANSELMLALIYRDHGDAAVHFVETTNERCTIQYRRRNAREAGTYTFSIEDARQARLSGDNWQKYPAAMLRARCISAVARFAFPDTIAGMYMPEELGASVDQETGEIQGPITAEPQRVGDDIVVEGEVLDAADSALFPAERDDPERSALIERFRRKAEAMQLTGKEQRAYVWAVTGHADYSDLVIEKLEQLVAHITPFSSEISEPGGWPRDRDKLIAWTKGEVRKSKALAPAAE